MEKINPFRRSDFEKALRPEQAVLLQLVSHEASRRGLPLYLVGGFVRDLLLGRPAADFDLVVEGDAIGLARALAAQHGGRVTAHLRFGTAQWFLPEPGRPELDFISTRSETYKHNAALPTVQPGGLVDDLARRDFSINTLAVRLDGQHWGELRDDLGGLDDLKHGWVRVLHDGSFQDDPTRLFRAVRYEQRYGFKITPQTLALMPAAHALIGALSAQRVRHELELVLAEEQAVSVLGRLAELDLLQPVHPALAWNETIRTRFQRGLQRLPEYPFKPALPASDKSWFGWHFWLMGTALPDLESLERRLHFHGNLLNSILAASGLFAELPAWHGARPSQWVMRLEPIPLTAIQAVWLASPDGPVQHSLSRYLENWRHVKPKTNGHDLVERGLPPGPAYQQVLMRLRQAWLDGEIKTEKEEMELLDKLT